MVESIREKLLPHWILAITSMVIICACATTALRSVWEDKSYQGSPFRKVLIIGVFQEQAAERFFEDEFVREMKKKGVDAIPGYRVFPEGRMTKQELMAKVSEMGNEMVSKVNEMGIDSVLVARLVDARDAGGYDTYPSRVDSGPSAAKYFSYYVMCCESTITLGYEVAFETKVFEVKSDKLIWSALSRTSFERSLENTVTSFIPYMISNLRNRKLI
jgi:hypothetical protein